MGENAPFIRLRLAKDARGAGNTRSYNCRGHAICSHAHWEGDE
jgi:hypothetical protein